MTDYGSIEMHVTMTPAGGGIAVGLSDGIMWNNATTFSSDRKIAVKSKMLNLSV